MASDLLPRGTPPLPAATTARARTVVIIRPMHIRNLITRGLFAAALSAASLTAPTAHAALLTSAYESQIEGWLGLGDLTFTTIYNPDPAGMSTAGFHAAVDGQGATITLLSVGPALYWSTPNQIIGGYNPQSWRSGNNSDAYNVTNSDADRTAFLFNLTDGSLLRQILTTETGGAIGNGEVQTYNHSTAGPAWGGGHDLVANLTDHNGSARDYSYGAASANDPITFDAGDGYPNYDFFTVYEIEVLTFAPAPIGGGGGGGSSVPDAGNTLGLLGMGIALLGFARIRGKKGVAA